jgi:hypothetical protein
MSHLLLFMPSADRPTALALGKASAGLHCDRHGHDTPKPSFALLGPLILSASPSRKSQGEFEKDTKPML